MNLIGSDSRSFLYVFSKLNVQVDCLLDIVSKPHIEKKDIQDLKSIFLNIRSILKKISYLEISEKKWKEIKGSTASKSWVEYKGSLTKRIIPSVNISIEKIINEKILEGIQIDILKERVNLLKQTIFGLSSASVL